MVCGLGGGRDVELSSEKMCTSCAQKVDHCKSQGGLSNEQDNAVSYSSNEFRFEAPSGSDSLSIDHSPSKSLFVFGGRDNNKQIDASDKVSANISSADIDSLFK